MGRELAVARQNSFIILSRNFFAISICQIEINEYIRCFRISGTLVDGGAKFDPPFTFRVISPQHFNVERQNFAQTCLNT